MRQCKGWAPFLAFVLMLGGCAQTQQNAPLVLERSIALPDVAGRIDHMAIDPAGRRLIVAELGNNAVDVIDLTTGAPVHRIANLHEPQGVTFDGSGNFMVIAERATGNVRVFDAATFVELSSIPLGEDADNVRVDPTTGYVVVGYGDGALGVVDLGRRLVLSRITLPAHPEGFQIDPRRGHILVNLPRAHAIGVIDAATAELRVSWPQRLWWNFPMAIDSEGARVATVFRFPARLVVLDAASGASIASADVCGDSDDVFLDPRLHRIYVACGAGSVDVLDFENDVLRRRAAVKTAPGARTALFAPLLQKLFVAAPAQHGGGATILVLRTQQ